MKEIQILQKCSKLACPALSHNNVICIPHFFSSSAPKGLIAYVMVCHTSVLPSLGPSVLPSVPSVQFSKCFFVISQPILILIILYDRAMWGISNFYTESWNSLPMVIYANLLKITKNADSPIFLNRFWFRLLYLVQLSYAH